MRLIIFFAFVLVLIVGAVVVFAAMQDNGPNPYADAATATDKITAPENATGAPDGNFAEVGKGGKAQWLLLDMGEGQEGTGDLVIHYKTAQNLDISVEFASAGENGGVPIEQQSVKLTADSTNVLVKYDKSPTPYRYVRIFASEERKYQIDAIITETYRPDSDRDSLPDEWEIKYGLNPLISTGKDGPNDDNDLDQLTNQEEFGHGTHPGQKDTDGDGLPELWEIDHDLDPTSEKGKNGASGDPDEDGLTNQQEYALGIHPYKKDTDKDELTDSEEINRVGTDPNNDDSDGDGMADGWEITFMLNPNNADGANGKDGDPDQDGLLNLDEFKAKSNPFDSDTDDDGTGDQQEVAGGTDPTNWDDRDFDKDGLTNGEEKKLGTDPAKPDTDNDGLLDGWELAKALNPLDSSGPNGAQGDPENDGVPNIREQQQGSSPNHPDTDQDGLPDAWEILHCLKPNDGTGNDGPAGDPDQDGKTNFVEMGLNEFPTTGCAP